MPAPDEYLSIARSGRGEIRIKGSRFIGLAQLVKDETQADRIRKQLKRQYHDAAHQPFAFRLADGLERISDDGEPHGTSGSSILLEIQRADLYDVQIVVVRYFGGTKLGKGGLARAFSECARMTLEKAGSKKTMNHGFLQLVLTPEEVNLARAIISKFGAEVISLSYDVKAHLHVAVPQSRMETCRAALENRFQPDIFEGHS